MSATGSFCPTKYWVLFLFFSFLFVSNEGSSFFVIGFFFLLIQIGWLSFVFCSVLEVHRIQFMIKLRHVQDIWFIFVACPVYI
jgi:hypothetical protein